jgi:hypothetical protein
MPDREADKIISETKVVDAAVVWATHGDKA